MEASLVCSYICPVTVGRRLELGLIRDRLRRASPGVILVSGDAGIGKSRLVADAAAEAVRMGQRVVWGSCFESDAGLPFAPLRDALRALLAIRTPAEIASLAGPHAASLAALLPEIAAGIGQAVPAVQVEQDKRGLFDALDSILAALAASAPLTFVVEDLHWSDAASLEFLLFLARRSARRPLALLVTYRGDEIGPDLLHFLAELDRDRLGLDVRLAGLASAEVDAMLRAIFGLTRPAPAELIHLLTVLTEGNPFFIEEVLPSLGVAAAEPAAGAFWTAREADSLRIPRSVQDAVRRRTARLSPAARRVLQLAAVAGRRFDFALLRDLAAVDESSLLDTLKQLVAAQLVVEESAERFAFRHALTRQAIYAELLTRERQGLHCRVGEALERSSAAGDGSVSDLAYHFFAGAAWDKAQDYSRRAGDHAMSLYAPGAAIGHFTRAMEAERRLSLAPDPELLRSRGAAHEVLGEFDRAQADYEAARDLARISGQRAAEVAAQLSLGLLWAARDYARAGAAIQDALVVAREIGDAALVARCLNRLGNWYLNSERSGEGQHRLREALAIVEELGDRRGVAETLDLLGGAAIFGGDLVQGTAYLRRAVDAWRELGDRRGLASSLILLAMRCPTYHTDTVPAVAGHTAVQPEVEEGLAIARAIGWRAGESWALWIMGGMVLATHGAYARAFEALGAALAIAGEIEHRQWLAAGHCMLGNAYADLLAFPRAKQHLELALSQARAADAHYWTRSATAWLASAALAQGDLAGAEAILDGALDPELSLDSLAPRLLWCVVAELALVRGEPDRALQIADRLVASALHAAGRPVARLEKLRGEALTALGDLEAAEAALRRACDTAAELGTRPVLWRASLALGRLYRTHGRQDEATAAFAAARALVDELAAEVPDEALRAGFLTDAAALFPAAPGPAARRLVEASPGGLTAREREVARLLTRGLSNREIAAALFVSEWTAATHIRNILAKLGLTSRTQIAAWAVEQGLVDRAKT
jgi:DNA-binding CsgD family transcriptional regulator